MLSTLRFVFASIKTLEKEVHTQQQQIGLGIMLSLAWNQYLSAEVYFLRAKIVASPTHDIDLDEVECYY